MAIQPMAYRLQAMCCSVRGARAYGISTPESLKSNALLDEARQKVKALHTELKGLSFEDNQSRFHIVSDTIQEIEKGIMDLRKVIEDV